MTSFAFAKAELADSSITYVHAVGVSSTQNDHLVSNLIGGAASDPRVGGGAQ
jgi:hypothetical protein